MLDTRLLSVLDYKGDKLNLVVLKAKSKEVHCAESYEATKITFDLSQIPLPETYSLFKVLNDIIYNESHKADSSLKTLREDYNWVEKILKK